MSSLLHALSYGRSVRQGRRAPAARAPIKRRALVATVWETQPVQDDAAGAEPPSDASNGASVRVDPPYWALRPRERHWEPLCPAATLPKKDKRWSFVKLDDQARRHRA